MGYTIIGKTITKKMNSRQILKSSNLQGTRENSSKRMFKFGEGKFLDAEK